MLIYVLLFSVAVALARGGRLKDIPTLKHLWLPPVALGLQLVTWLTPGSGSALVLSLASYSGLFFFIVANAEQQGLRVILLGILLNMLAIVANGGRIPVDVAAAVSLGYDVEGLVMGLEAKHVALDSDTLLPFLGDVIPVRFPTRKLLSVGDIFIFLGLFLTVQELLGKRIAIFGPGGQA